MVDLTVNWGFTSNAQTGDSDLRRRPAAVMEDFARIIVEDVAYRQSGYFLESGARTLAGRLETIIEREIATMAMRVQRGLNLTGRVKGHRGAMSISGGISETAKQRGWYGSSFNWQRGSTGITWDERSKSYLNWKRNKGKSQNWWNMNGSLLDYLGQASTYTSAFGDVKVTVDRQRFKRGQLGRGGEGLRFTSSGMRGPVVAEYQIARVRVSYLGRITASDLPSLRTENPKDARPASGPGLARMLGNSDERTKLLRGAHKTGRVRYTLEPFLSFYMTRAIPNAVWRRLEQESIVETTAGRSGNVSYT